MGGLRRAVDFPETVRLRDDHQPQGVMIAAAPATRTAGETALPSMATAPALASRNAGTSFGLTDPQG
jgi:hypothetical protein